MALPDIRSEQNVRVVVDAFYEDIERSRWLGRFFEGVDMPAHLPKVYAF